MLIKLGFVERRVQLIMKYVTIAKLNILHNGKEIGTIIPEVRQGDPLSPCLFIIYAEGLSMSLSSVQEKGLVHGCKVARGAIVILHLFFAYDNYLLF